MPPAKSKAAPAKKYFSVDQANKMLPLVQKIVGDIVSQFRMVEELDGRLRSILKTQGTPRQDDPYSEEVAQSRAELEAEAERLRSYQDELEGLGVELKGADGLCDFPAMKEGREVYLCWKLGEPSVDHWHEVHAGFAGRKPIDTFNVPTAPARPGPKPR